jgi:hypothetical protein
MAVSDMLLVAVEAGLEIANVACTWGFTGQLNINL